MHILSRAVNFSLLAGPNPSEQKPNQTNKRLVCSYTAQRQQQKLGSCYFELFCNGLSSIMTRTVATHPRSRTLHLRLHRGSSWTKLKALCFHGKALSVMEAVVEVLFNLYKQTTVILRPLKLELDDVVIKYNYSIRGKYPEKRTCSPT